MAITQGSKWDAAEALLSLLLKADEIYCEACGETYNEKFPQCCDDPLLGTHKHHLKELIKAIKDSNQLNFNVYGSNKAGNLRSCFAMPKKLMLEWMALFEKEHDEKLFRSYDKKLYKIDVRNAMRKFPYLCRCEKV